MKRHEINSRADFLRRRARGRVQSVNIDALVRKTGPVGWILFLEARVFFGNALNALSRRIEDKFGREKLMRIEVPGNSGLLFG